MSNSSSSISAEAYAKAALHCLKHSTQATMGLLVGKTYSSQGDKDTKVFVTDIVPISHSMPMTAPHPVLAMALLQTAAVCQSKGTAVVGCYVANERAVDNTVSDHTKKVVKALAESEHVSRSSELLLWQLDNTVLTGTGVSTAISGRVHVAKPNRGGDGSGKHSAHKLPNFTTDSSIALSFAKWDTVKCAAKSIDAEVVKAMLKGQIELGAYAKMVDFEDHLENVDLDYHNESVLVNISGGDE